MAPRNNRMSKRSTANGALPQKRSRPKAKRTFSQNGQAAYELLFEQLRGRYAASGAKFKKTMAADLGRGYPKTPPRQVADATLDGIRSSRDEVLADESAEQLWRRTRADPESINRDMQRIWDERPR